MNNLTKNQVPKMRFEFRGNKTRCTMFIGRHFGLKDVYNEMDI